MEEIKYFIRYILDKKGITKAEEELKKLNNINKQVSQDIPRATRIMTKNVNYSLDKQGNSIRNLTIQWKSAESKLWQTSLKIKNGTEVVGTSVKKVSSVFGNFGKDISNIATRALKTIPVWFALRRAMMTIFTTIRDQMDYLRELDTALARASAVIHGTADATEALGEIQENAEELAKKYGQSIKDVLEAYYRFGTVGHDVQTSLEGMNVATKLAVALMGDETKIADILAHTYYLLGDTLDKSIPKKEHLATIAGMLAKLWTVNRFEIGEMASALERFLPTAEAYNVSLSDSIALLASLHQAGLKGSRGARLLRTTFANLITNSRQLAKELGIVIKSTEEVDLSKLLNQVVEYYETTGRVPRTLDEIAKTFQKRGMDIINALIAIHDTWNRNISITKENYKDLGSFLDDLANKQINTMSRIEERLRATRRRLLEDFGFGSEYYKELLVNITWMMDELDRRLRAKSKEGAKKRTLKDIYVDLLGYNPIGFFTKSWHDNMKEAERRIEESKKRLEKKNKELNESMRKGIEKGINESLDKMKEAYSKTVGKIAQEMANITRKIRDTEDMLTEGNKEFVLSLMKLSGASDQAIAMADLEMTVANIVKQAERMNVQIDEGTILSKIFNNEWVELYDILDGVVDLTKTIPEIQKKSNKILLEGIKNLKKYSDEIKKAFESDLKDLLTGKTDFSGFIDAFRSKLIDMWAGLLSKDISALLSTTGIFDFMGGAFKRLDDVGTIIINSSYEGAQYFREAIINGSREAQGMTPISTVKPPAMGYPSIGGFPMIGGMPMGISSMGTMMPVRAPMMGGTQIPAWFPFSGRLGRPIGQWWNRGQMTWGQGLMSFGMGAMMGYETGGTAGAITGGIGSLLMTAGHPLLALPFLLFGLFRRKKTVERRSSWTPEDVKELFPYFGINVPPLPTIYPLPSSRYFGRVSPIEVNININKIEGTNEKIAEKIAEQVKVSIGKALPVEYMRNIERGGMIQQFLF